MINNVHFKQSVWIEINPFLVASKVFQNNLSQHPGTDALKVKFRIICKKLGS